MKDCAWLLVADPVATGLPREFQYSIAIPAAEVLAGEGIGKNFRRTGEAFALDGEGGKKRFATTPAGVEHLAAHRAEAEAALARLDALARKDEALDTGPVFRAMSNLKAALRMRLAGEPDKALVFAVADAIDEAARKIERL